MPAKMLKNYAWLSHFSFAPNFPRKVELGIFILQVHPIKKLYEIQKNCFEESYKHMELHYSTMDHSSDVKALYCMIIVMFNKYSGTGDTLW